MARCGSDLVRWLTLLRESGVRPMQQRRAEAWLAEFVLDGTEPQTSAEASEARAALIGDMRLRWARGEKW